MTPRPPVTRLEQALAQRLGIPTDPGQFTLTEIKQILRLPRFRP
jgi:hypothetical protein